MIAVAGNFTKTAKDLAASFEESTGHTVVISYGSTGKLYAQILHDAPFEVFLAADSKHPAMLSEKGKAVPDSIFTYGKGKVALFSMDKSLPDQEEMIKQLMPAVDKLALANPKTAPYGEATIEILKSLGLYADLENKLVLGDNLIQTYQFVYTGNATVGFVSLSQVINEETGSFWVVPEQHYTPINQDAVLLEKGVNNQVALDFLAFLRSDDAKKIIHHYGYATSGE